MPIIQSRGGLVRLTAARPLVTATASVNGGGASFVGLSSTYAATYAAQPNIRTCVDFLARNMAQIGLHIFRRIDDTDRERLTPATHPLARWLERPNPQTTGYRLMEDLMGDLGIYFNAFLRKVRVVMPREVVEGSVRFAKGEERVMLIRLPPEEVWVVGNLLASSYEWRTTSGVEVIDPNDLIHFKGYNPLDPLSGLSPLETLRQVLEQEQAATLNRSAYWLNASRIEGVIERPLAAPRWNREQKQEWRRQWGERYAGPGNAGSVPVLEDGMSWKPTSFSAQDSEYTASRKLTREECASAYHIPLPMVGILEHATFSNIKEQHKQLYADTMGPWCQMVQQQFELALLMEVADPDDIYFEFNIAEKLKGSFEELSAALRASVGRPYMTANEARARLNLPRIADDPSADELAAQQGGPQALPAATGVMEGHVEQIVRATWDRQASRLNKLPPKDRGEEFDVDRAINELAADLTPLFSGQVLRAREYAARITTQTYTLLVAGEEAFAGCREVPPCTIH